MQILFFFLIIIPSAIIHEYAHGWMADQLGDPTAKDAGRLTLNPLSHIDWWGTVLMPITLILLSGGSFVFAYAKPVPYNPYNLRNQKRDPAFVALAGPLSNLFLAIVFAMFYRFLPVGFLNPFFFDFLSLVVYANVLLLVFNLVPIPPLDGSKVLFAVLPDNAWRAREFLERNGFIVLLFFLMFGFKFITPIVYFLFNILINF